MWVTSGSYVGHIRITLWVSGSNGSTGVTHFQPWTNHKMLPMPLWLASYIHAYTNETHSIANIQDLIPTLALVVCVAAKVGIKSCRFAIECVSFVHAWM